MTIAISHMSVALAYNIACGDQTGAGAVAPV
jgi:hypothetical protein